MNKVSYLIPYFFLINAKTINKTIDKQININPIGNKAKGSFMNPFSSTSLPMSSNETKHIIPITSRDVAILYLVAIYY